MTCFSACLRTRPAGTETRSKERTGKHLHTRIGSIRWLYTTGLCGGWSFVEEKGRERENIKTERCMRRKRECMHYEIAWGSVEFSPEPQLTQTQKKLHCKHANLGFSFGTISLVSARAFFQNIGHWFAVKKESRILLFPPRTTHPRYLSELCALERCTTQSVPHLDSFSFEDDWKMVPPNQPAF